MASVLSVDDSLSIRTLVSDTLTDAGFSVRTAEDGLAGLDVAKNNPVDLMIVDVNMPRMGGIEMVSEVRKLPEHKYTPILMLTTVVDAEKKKAAKAAGATAWLIKPFDPDKLLAVIRKVLD